MEIYDLFKFEGQELEYDQILNLFDAYYCRKENIDFERYKFMECVQSNFTISEYVTKLKQIALNCEFGELSDSPVKSKLISGINSDKLRKRLLQDSALTLEKAIELCFTNEEIDLQARVIKSTHVEDHAEIDQIQQATPRRNQNNAFSLLC